MEIDWVKLTDAALHVASSILAGLVLAYFGLRIYFRQKEYELVKQRYLEQCLDVVAGELEETSSVFLHNWARCLELVKELRDAPENFDKAHIDQGFLPFRGSNFNQPAHHRLRVLTESKVFWDCYQLALVEHMALNAIVAKEIPHAISEFVSGRIHGSESGHIVDIALNRLKPMTSQSGEFSLLQNALQRIAAELERSNLSFNQVESFAKRPIIRSIVKDLEERYGSQIAGQDIGDVA